MRLKQLLLIGAALMLVAAFNTARADFVLQPGPGLNDGADDGSATKGKDAAVFRESVVGGLIANGGAETEMDIYNSPCNIGANGGALNVYLQFSTDGLIAQDGTNATVEVYCRVFYNGCGWPWPTNPAVTMRRVTQPWNEMTVTATNSPTSDPAILDMHTITVVHGGIPGCPQPVFMEFEGWLSFDVSSTYAGWISGSLTNCGVEFRLDPPICANGDVFQFYSSDHTNAALRPRLVVRRFPTNANTIRPVLNSRVATTNMSFEILPTGAGWPGTYGFTDHIPGWTCSGGTGVGWYNSTLVTSTTLPDGVYAGFLYLAGSSLSQNVSSFIPGKAYTVQFMENMRAGYVVPNCVQVNLGGTNLATYSFTNYGSGGLHTRFCRRVMPAWIATATNALLLFTNSGSGDNTWNIDAVSITRAVPVVSNCGFEFGNSANYTYAPTNAAWTFAAAAGIAYNTLTPPVGVVTPEGHFCGYVHCNYPGGTNYYICQTLSGFEPGVTYVLKWWDAGRYQFGGADYTVSLGGQAIYNSATNPAGISTVAWTARAARYSATTNTAVLQFTTQNYSSGLPSTCYDDIHFEFAAEPLAVFMQPTGQGSLLLGWSAAAGTVYQVQCATDLAAGNWTNYGSSTTTTNGEIWVTNAISSEDQRFYRVFGQ